MPTPANPLSLLYRHRDLVRQFTARELQLRHKGSRLGHFWALLSPLTMLCLYLFVFGLIMGGKFGVLKDESTYDFALALFLGLSLFHIISETLGAAPSLIFSQPNLVKKVVFPLEIIPVAHVASSLYHSLLSLLLLIVAACFSHSGIAWTGLLTLPLLLLPLAMISLGLAWGMSALGVYLRDIAQLTPFLAQVLVFASAVFYSPSKLAGIPPIIATVLQANPLLHVIEQARRTLLWHQGLEWSNLGPVYLVALVIMGMGYLVFSRLRPYFPEVI